MQKNYLPVLTHSFLLLFFVISASETFNLFVKGAKFPEKKDKDPHLVFKIYVLLFVFGYCLPSQESESRKSVHALRWLLLLIITTRESLLLSLEYFQQDLRIYHRGLFISPCKFPVHSPQPPPTTHSLQCEMAQWTLFCIPSQIITR